MPRQRKAPGRYGPVNRMPWSGDSWPTDWGRSNKRGKRMTMRSPRPGARTGPVRGSRR